MFRPLFFIIKIALLVALAVWVSEQTGVMQISWMGYEIKAHIGFFLGASVIVILTGLFIQRFFLSILHRLRTRHLRKRQDELKKGYGTLTQSLSALASGNTKQARDLTKRAGRLIQEDTELAVFIQAQAAYLDGKNEEAERLFAKLLTHSDTVFLGLRGILQAALAHNDTERALRFAEKAYNKHPKQHWVITTYYKLLLRERQWDKATEILSKIEKLGALPAADIKSEHIALLLQQARIDELANRPRQAIKKRKQAHKLDAGFVPAALALIQDHLSAKQKGAARKVFEACWKLSPHPELSPLWKQLAPSNKPSDPAVRLRWFERLITLNPDNGEGRMAAANIAIDDRLWGEAREHLRKAEKEGCQHARFYRLWAHLEESQGHTADAKHYYDKASQAPADKVWICSETGLIYDHWYALAEPHGSFNTIKWDNPSSRKALSSATSVANTLLVDDISSAA